MEIVYLIIDKSVFFRGTILNMSDNLTHFKYAVIGAGVAGTYCAWRLKKNNPKDNVALFEYSDRIGGRLLTTHLPEIPNVNAELGGMRFIPNIQPLITSLIGKLGLATRKFSMGTEEDRSGLKNYAYLRGKYLRIGEMNDSKKIPFNVNWCFRNMNPDQIQTQVMKLLVPNWKELSLDDWFNVEVFGKPLWEYGFWNLLFRVLDSDTYAFLKYGSGYDTNVSNGNAVTLLPTGGEYISTVDYMTLVDGMDALPKKLVEEFQRETDRSAFLNHRLARIHRQENGVYHLEFVRTHTTANRETKDIEPDERYFCLTDHIILAMPRRSLELIEWDCWKKNEFLRQNLDSVLIQGAIKIFLAYEYAWWTGLGFGAGRSITDLPIRQTFYFSESDNISNKRSLLMASYSDLESLPFWKGLEDKGLKRALIAKRDANNGDANNEFESKFLPGPEGHRISRLMVNETHRQIVELHGLKELEKPYAAAYQDWSKDPFGGAWHSWKGGFKYNDIMPRMLHPVPQENVYICGEAYSNDQGWAEGALETAELVLTKKLKIPPLKDVSETWSPDPLKRMRYPSWFSQG
ncbi:NAD(P)/FAD-dependent oxidoreductase [Microcoleus sp. N3A4]